jgi:hypothetical protein
MQRNSSIAINGMGNVSIGSIVIGNALAHMNRPVVYSPNIHGIDTPKYVFSRCSICHKMEYGTEQNILGKGKIFLGKNETCERKLKRSVETVLSCR